MLEYRTIPGQSLEENWVRHAKDKKNREQQHQEFQRNGRQLTVKETELHDIYDILFKIYLPRCI